MGAHDRSRDGCGLPGHSNLAIVGVRFAAAHASAGQLFSDNGRALTVASITATATFSIA
jgi:hypothetical protein